MSTDSSNNSAAAEDLGFRASVELNSSFSHFSHKADTNNSPGSSPTVNRRHDFSALKEQVIQQQILELKKHQEMQQQVLLQRFHVQQQQLAELHEQELRRHLRELWDKQREVEERELREKMELERMESLKKKEKHSQSANASSEVKQKLQGFLLNKKHREAVAAHNSPQSRYRSWTMMQSEPNVAAGGGAPYCINNILGKYEEEYPLRKTASEPNLLKMRLKHRVSERQRCSPLARKNRLIFKKKSYLAESLNSNSNSGPNSPPMNMNSQMSPSGGHTTPILEEVEPTYGKLNNNNIECSSSSVNDLSLFNSPSLPNISLGKPQTPMGDNLNMRPSANIPASEAAIRAALSARLGMPLTGSLLPTTLPYYPTLPGIETIPEYSSANSSAYIPKPHSAQMHALEQARQSYFPSIYDSSAPITDSQVAFARLNKQGRRPLGRTQSAPLPLGHPMLTTPQGNNLGVHYENCAATAGGGAGTHQQQMQAHNYLKQQIRQTVLTRVGNRSHNTIEEGNKTDEEEEEDDEKVIDLTGGRNSSMSVNSNSQPSQKQIRDSMYKNMLGEGSGHSIKPLARAFSSPLVALNNESMAPSSISNHYMPPMKIPSYRRSPHTVTTALAFDSLMLKHACICGDNSSHAEHGGRLQSVWARLVETGLVQRCDRVRSRKATLEELQTCHTESHTLLFGTNPLNRQKMDASKFAELSLKTFVRLGCGGIGVDSDTTWNEVHTASAARMAVGCVADLAFKAASGDIKNGFAIVRPPGHHAEANQAMGFCFFNSVAIAAKLLQQKMDLRRILIVDWDIHHGNGTQPIFYSDRRVLYISIHRHDDGNFFPGTGSPMECGSDAGLGFNVNVAWSGGLNPPLGDAEYLAAFRTIVMPIAREYVPDIILVSAGFDASSGHPPPLGGYNVSPACFGFMTQQLTQLADGKVILSLEGGYDLPAICDCSEECVRALLDGSSSPVSEEELCRRPCKNAVDALQKTIAIQIAHWPILKKSAHTVAFSAMEATRIEENETIRAMASLSMNKRHSSNLQNSLPETSEEPMEEDEGNEMK